MGRMKSKEFTHVCVRVLSLSVVYVPCQSNTPIFEFAAVLSEKTLSVRPQSQEWFSQRGLMILSYFVKPHPP